MLFISYSEFQNKIIIYNWKNIFWIIYDLENEHSSGTIYPLYDETVTARQVVKVVTWSRLRVLIGIRSAFHPLNPSNSFTEIQYFPAKLFQILWYFFEKIAIQW